MATRHAVPFPRLGSDVPRVAQKATRAAHQQAVSHVAELVETLDGDDYGALLSELSERGVLILGRFTDRRRKILEAIKQRLRQHPARYKPVLFTFDRPPSRDLVESIRWFAGASRFVIADLTEPKSLPAELQAIVPDCPSLPLVAIVSGSTREYPLFKHIKRYKSVIEKIVRYDGEPTSSSASMGKSSNRLKRGGNRCSPTIEAALLTPFHVQPRLREENGDA